MTNYKQRNNQFGTVYNYILKYNKDVSCKVLSHKITMTLMYDLIDLFVKNVFLLQKYK